MASSSPNVLQCGSDLPLTTSAAIVLDQPLLEATEEKVQQSTLEPVKEEREEKSVLGSDLQLFAVNLHPLKRLSTTRANQLLITSSQDPKEDSICSSSCAWSCKIYSEEDLCVTPKAKEHQIPEAKACPPAPKKKVPAKRKRDYDHNQPPIILDGALVPNQRAYFVNPPDLHTFPDSIKALFKE